jgi:5-methylcytosine-specific restriction endonuclease McrA
MAKEYIPYTGPIVTRVEAIRAGLKHYFTGKPCASGHLSPRFTLYSNCMACNRMRRLVWHAANKEKSNSQSRGWYHSNPDKRQVYRDANKDRIRAASKANKLLHKDRIKVERKAWWRANPDKMAEIRRNRKALRGGASGKHTNEDIVRIRKAQKDRCALCRVNLKGAGHVDHIIAVSKGGSNWPKNLQMLCVRCNCRKRDDDPIDFSQRLGLLL